MNSDIQENTLSVTFISFHIGFLTILLVYQILELCEVKGDMKKKAHEVIDNYANRGLRSLGVARQVE